MSSTARNNPTESPVGVLGGTFDPIHNAHLRLVEEAQARIGLDQVLFVPAGRPWHRSPPVASARDRVAMVRLAIADRPGFEVDDAEASADAPGYTIETLERLRSRFGPRRPLVLLLGADAFLGLTSWHRWMQILDLAHLAVATRPGHDLTIAGMPAPLAAEYQRRLAEPETLSGSPAGGIAPFILSAGTTSSTQVRTRLASGQNVRELLPDAVVDYIGHRNLYPTRKT
jgi:nicotinate-nucleotide adenylyltransferase